MRILRQHTLSSYQLTHCCCYEFDFIASHFSSHTRRLKSPSFLNTCTQAQGCDTSEKSRDNCKHASVLYPRNIYEGNHVVLLKENCMKFITFQMPHMDFLRNIIREHEEAMTHKIEICLGCNNFFWENNAMKKFFVFVAVR